MNRVILIGNLTKDPEIRTTTTGKKVATFSVAVNDGKGQDGQDLVQYFNIKAWDKNADIIESYVRKGHKLAISGRLSNRSWDAPDGTKKYATEIVLNEMEMLTSRADAERINQQSQNSQQGQSSAAASSQSAPEPKKNTSGSQSGNNELPAIDINDLDMKVQMPF